MGVFECVSASKITPTESTEVFTINMSSNATLNETRRDVESQSTKTGYWSRHRLWWTLGVDIPLLLILLILVGLFELGIIPNNKAGFYCNDPALSFPFNGDTVNTEMIISTVLLMPIFFVAITEYAFIASDFLTGSRMLQTCKNTFYIYRTYIYGLVFNLTIVEVMKGLAGTPRPTFFDLCEPDTLKTCNGSEFVSNFQCTSTKYPSWYQMDSYRSFPSGHSSMSVYCGVFIAWYLQRRAFDWSHRSVFLVPILQMLCISYAAICSLTRITDHRHHWWDVLIGSGIGLATVYYAVIISRNFSYHHSSKTCDLKSEESRNTVRTLLYDERRPVTVS